RWRCRRPKSSTPARPVTQPPTVGCWMRTVSRTAPCWPACRCSSAPTSAQVMRGAWAPRRSSWVQRTGTKVNPSTDSVFDYDAVQVRATAPVLFGFPNPAGVADLRHRLVHPRRCRPVTRPGPSGPLRPGDSPYTLLYATNRHRHGSANTDLANLVVSPRPSQSL